MANVSFNVKEGEGLELSQAYKVGHTFPVFILTDREGEIIYRWTGYTGAVPFITSLNKALADLTTVKERKSRFAASPTHDAALMLARYFTDTGEYTEAIEYFLEAEKLDNSKRSDYSYDIFTNSANAAWNDMISFEDVLPRADTILYAARKNDYDIVRMAQIMSRLARKLQKEDNITKYLQAGIDIAAKSRQMRIKEKHVILTMEYALQIEHDTSKALGIKKEDMGTDWARNPAKFFSFSKWCLERRINLEEAEQLARKATKFAKGSDFKAQVYSTVAEICYVRGNLEEAIKFIDLAIEQDPKNTAYSDNLDTYLEAWEKR